MINCRFQVQNRTEHRELRDGPIPHREDAPNWMICALDCDSGASSIPARNRRSDHRDGAFRFTLGNRPWPGTTRTLPPLWAGRTCPPSPPAAPQEWVICAPTS
jgi:hypothetical protein